jgi:hypothetical protein
MFRDAVNSCYRIRACLAQNDNRAPMKEAKDERNRPIQGDCGLHLAFGFRFTFQISNAVSSIPEK